MSSKRQQLDLSWIGKENAVASTPDIQPMFEAFYLESMLFNSRSALTSFQQLSDMLAEGHWAAGDSQTDNRWNEMLDALQNAISKSAALARCFWPVRDGKSGEHKRRGSQLRQAFAVADESPLRGKNLRDSLEHFDERLDRYLASGIVGHVLPSYVGYAPANRDIPLHVFRAYYVDTGVFEILGEQYQIPPLVDEILRLHAILERCIDDEGRLPKSGSNTDTITQ
jgi:hypothetical protein